jgi:hydroxymethylpyrimidine pyrophosphatase-like HAD family hydrolase
MIAPISNYKIPIIVDLDGTLTEVDTLSYSLKLIVKKNFFYTFFLGIWVLQGKASFKDKVAKHSNLDAKDILYRSDLIKWLRSEKRKGRKIVLCTGANWRVAKKIATHLKLFDDVIASDSKINNISHNKSMALNHRYGKYLYDYAGNSSQDLDVWKNARGAILVNANRSVYNIMKNNPKVLKVFN